MVDFKITINDVPESTLIYLNELEFFQLLKRIWSSAGELSVLLIQNETLRKLSLLILPVISLNFSVYANMYSQDSVKTEKSSIQKQEEKVKEDRRKLSEDEKELRNKQIEKFEY